MKKSPKVTVPEHSHLYQLQLLITEKRGSCWLHIAVVNVQQRLSDCFRIMLSQSKHNNNFIVSKRLTNAEYGSWTTNDCPSLSYIHKLYKVCAAIITHKQQQAGRHSAELHSAATFKKHFFLICHLVPNLIAVNIITPVWCIYNRAS